jgi:hypothetical protein
MVVVVMMVVVVVVRDELPDDAANDPVVVVVMMMMVAVVVVVPARDLGIAVEPADRLRLTRRRGVRRPQRRDGVRDRIEQLGV